MTQFPRRSFLGGAALIMLALTTGCSSEPQNVALENLADDAAAGEPVFAILTVPVGKSGPSDYAAQLVAARDAGRIDDILFLEAKPSVEGPLGFASLAVVELADDENYESWSRDISTRLGADVVVKRADLLVDERSTNHSASPVYVVSHYEALVPSDEYKSYTQAYIAPNMDSQKAGGVMSGYAMYYEREPVGTKSKTVLVKEYVDEAAFNRSEAVKEAAKPGLLADAEWKRINDTKTTIRTDLSSTLATPVALR